MEQYIPKSALVAEIEKLKGKVYDGSSYCDGWQHALRMLELSLNTVETKEVDLGLNSFDATVCKIGSTYLKEMDRNAIAKVLEPYKDGDKVKVIIKSKGE